MWPILSPTKNNTKVLPDIFRPGTNEFIYYNKLEINIFFCIKISRANMNFIFVRN
jgi:hypothetical protein